MAWAPRHTPETTIAPWSRGHRSTGPARAGDSSPADAARAPLDYSLPVHRLLLVVTTRSYRAGAFVDAARALGLPLTVASERAQALAGLHPEGHLVIDASHPRAAADAIVRFAAHQPLSAIVAADDDGVAIAAAAAAALGLPHHPLAAVRAARDKHAMRETLAAAGVPGPAFARVSLSAPVADMADAPGFPCVVKPLGLSMSRGVMRAGDPAELARALERLSRLPGAGAEALVERYVTGPEVALEGLVTRGRLRTLALFDKPDPLEGPTFEETIYVTPSRLPAGTRRAVEGMAQRVVTALGLVHGPVHAELRIPPAGPIPIEIAPRSIGGLCSRALRFAGGATLEQVLLQHALQGEDPGQVREAQAAGVMMIPIPAAGTLRGVQGLDAARASPGIDEVRITIPVGDRVVPLPEGDRYLGFVFARAPEPAAAEAALRAAHRLLTFDIEPVPARGASIRP
jgi:biotin carboxylase